ncbi:MAG: glycoside hydrolase family 65 protein [Formosimonas sp.]
MSHAPHSQFAHEAWRICEREFAPEHNLLNETLFTVGNGYIGLRGGHDEGFHGDSQDATFLNGFYDTNPIHHPETAYGLAKTNQFMLNVPNGKRIVLTIDGEQLDVQQGQMSAYERSLDFKTGVLTRSFEWTSPSGKTVKIRSERVVSLAHKHIFAIRYSVTAVNFAGAVQIESVLDGEVKNLAAGDDPRVGTHLSAAPLLLASVEQRDSFSALVHNTRNSGFQLVSAIDSSLNVAAQAHNAVDGERVARQFAFELAQGQSATLIKFGAYFTSRDYPQNELLSRSQAAVREVKAAGFDALLAQQAEYLSDFWQKANVEIEGDDALCQGLHFNQFHLLQSMGRDGKTNISAKGVTGEGYEGHYFWDTEIYVFPFFLATQPEIARQLLAYRYQGLGAARERARAMSLDKGALYPWRTIAGDECSAYFPAGTAQYHINADVAYSIKQYYDMTGDDVFLISEGAEIILETARLWLSIGAYNPQHPERFGIYEVTGPDEYTAMVNNNLYTNVMAQLHLNFAVKVARQLKAEHPADFARISNAIDLDDSEIDDFARAAEHMYVPYDEKLGVHPQDDTFLSKPVWNFAATPADNYPLLLNYHPLVIYRHQVCKQADVVLALLLRGNAFALADKRRDFDYYEPITTHDSSLSACIFGVVASEVGYHDRAYDFFMQTARMDIDNMHGNTQHGVHTAAMAGSWLGVVAGFAGMRVYDGALQFTPTLPAAWTRYRFNLTVRGNLINVQVEAGQATYQLLRGDGLTFNHCGNPITLMPHDAVSTKALS